ncbi:MAG: leucine--tRNA ligase, partial [Candidatus Aenigmarchaeota archaeon]|nr:leucine--tRNA ligase [Candidatus Aenigmarchaeota archaeon]
SEIEKKWQKRWEGAKIFEVKEDLNKKKFYILEMFPYPSAYGLHMGHAFNYTISDIYARYKRMKNFNVLYPVGYDALGLPAENAAIKAGEHPEDYTEKSIKNFMRQQKSLGLSYDWSRIINTSNPEYYKWDQWIFLKMYEKGLVYRKKSPVNWCPKCKTVLANEQVHNGRCWRHPDTKVEIKHLEQWFIKITEYADELYEDIEKLKEWPEDIKAMQRQWIGKSHGTEIEFEINGKKWPIFTTRPDTIYGVTFMVISAQHPDLMELVTDEQKGEVEEFLKKIRSVSEKELENLEKEGVFTGSYAINPVTGDKVPVYVGNFVIAEYGSGMVMAVPAHDQRDFEFAERYLLPIKRVIIPPVLGAVAGVSEEIEREFDRLHIEYTKKDDTYYIMAPLSIKDETIRIIQKYMREGFYSDIYVDREVFVVLPKKVYNISKGELDLAQEEIDKLSMPQEFSDLRKIRDEWKDFVNNDIWKMKMKRAYVDEGYLINSGKFTGMNNKEAIKKISEYLEKNGIGKRTIQYKLRDWLISRQRYWGTPIPVVYCDKCGVVPVPEDQLPVKLPRNVKFGEGNPLATNEEWINTTCPKCGGPARRETDTMDTFVNSSWYFLRYCDPRNEKEIFDKNKVKYWMPIDIYIGGREHACMHLIYFRFYTKFLRDLGLLSIDEPAIKLFNQGMLHGEDGFKMSKSRGNVVLPDEVSKRYGIDSARLFLVSMASPSKDIKWSEKGIEGSFRFLKRVIKYFDNVKIGKASKLVESKTNRYIKSISDDIENLRYNYAVIKLRDLFRYYENEDEMSKNCLETFLKLLHPFCPHITEELWEKIGNNTFISISKWPEADESKIDEESELEEELIKTVMSDIEEIKRIIKVQNPKKIKLFVSPEWKYDIYNKIMNGYEIKDL